MSGSTITSILFVELLGGIGDLVLALPAIHALARTHAPARVSVVTFPPAGRLLVHDPWVDECLELPRGRAEDVCTAVRMLRERRQWDIVACDSMYGGLERAVAGWGRVATVTNLWRDPPVDELIDVRFLHLLNRDGLVDRRFLRLPPRIALTPQERDSGRERLERLLGGTRPRILFIPDAGMVIKRWPVARWRALAARLDAELGAAVAVVAGDDSELTTAIVREGCGVALPRLELRELAAVAAAADVCVGPDTGPVRIAAAVGTPTVALYGPTTAARFGLRARHVNLDSPLPCSERKPGNMTEQSCWYSGTCVFPDRRNCLEDISVEVVFDAVRASTREVGGHPRTPGPGSARSRDTRPPSVRR
ncbi:MAG: glycosyltransferase family 9 protein [Actinomycetota bacterium]|nr:glycosyltransferase family 9 protein [Actinomycetota bacterium]